MLRRAIAPLSPGAVLGYVVVCALVAGLQTIGLFTWYPIDMRQVIVTIREAAPLWCLPMGWLAVLVVAVHDKRSIIVGSVPGRPRSLIVARHLLVLGAATMTGVLIGFLPAIVRALGNGEVFGSDLLAFGVLLLSLLALAGMAYAVAALFPLSPGMVLTPLILFGIVLFPSLITTQVLPNTGYSAIADSWYWGFIGPTGSLDFRWQTELARLIFFAAVTVAAGYAATGWAGVRGGGRKIQLSGGAAFLAAPLAIAVVTTVLSPEVVKLSARARPDCRPAGPATVCMAPLNEPLREEISDIGARIAQVIPAEVRPDPFVIREVRMPVPGLLTYPEPFGTKREWLNQFIGSTAGPLGGVEACQDLSSDSFGLGQGVGQAIVLRAGLGTGASDSAVDEASGLQVEGGDPQKLRVRERLVAMPVPEFEAWMKTHYPAVLSCRLTASDIDG